MKIALYFDEDAQDNDLIQALRLRGADVTGAWASGMRQREDAEHLAYATAQGRVLYGFNVGDFYRLHTELLTRSKSHAGIILAKQQHYSVGDRCAELLKLIATKSAEEMRNEIEFLSGWV